MKYTKFLMALAVACIIIMPAFSMPYNGMGQDDKQNKWTSNPMMGQDGKENQCNCQAQCNCQNSMGQDDQQNKWNGEQNKCQKSMMGHDAKDGKENQCNCQNSNGQGDKQNMWEGKQNNQCQCQNFMGQDGKQMEHKPIKSMMEKMGQDGKGMCHRPVKSMMGHHDGIKAVIVTVKIIE